MKKSSFVAGVLSLALVGFLVFGASNLALAAGTTATSITVGSQTGTLTYGTTGSATFAVAVSGSGNGNITIGVSGLPTGVTSSPTSKACNASSGGGTGCNFTLTLTTTGSGASRTPAVLSNTFTVQVAGDGGGSPTNTSTITVGKRAITVTAATNTKTYDSTTSAAATPTITSGSLLAGDTASFVETYSNKNAGTSKTLTPSGSITDGNGGANYAVTFANNLTGVINARALTVTAATNSKTYDGNTTSAATPTITSGALQGSDTANFNESYATATAGTSKTLVPSGSVTDGNIGLNYAVTFVNNLTGVISARPITVTAATNSKTYDGTTSAAAIPTVTSGTLVASDTAAFSEIYDTKNVGTGKTLTPSGSVTDGNGGANYTITFVNNTTGVINAKTLAVTATGVNKTYDGTTNASVSYSLSGVVAPDSVGATGTAAFANKNVGVGKPVSVTGITLTGADAGNYTSNTTTGTTADISARAITVTANTNSKAYDSTTSAAATPSITSGTLAAGDSAAFTETYSTKTVGTGKTLVPAGSVTDGNGGANYTITFVNNTTGVISSVALTGSITADSKTYDGTDAATIATRSLSGVIGSDDVTYVGGSATFDDKNVGTGKTVTATGLTLSGADAGNYTVNATATTNADITPKGIAVTADLQTKVYGSADPSLTYVSDPLFSGDSFTGDLSRVSGENVGTYAIQQGTLTAGDNYTITFNGADLTITKADATIVVNGYTGVYDAAAHGATGSALGVNSEDLSADLDFGASFTDVPGGTADWTFTGGTNYNDASGTAAIVINKADAVVTVTPYSVTYDAAAHTAVGTATGVNSEDLSAGLTLSGTTHTNAGTYNGDVWSFSGGTNYNDQNGTVDDLISKADADITVTPYAVIYDSNAHTATGSALGVEGETLAGLDLSGTTHTNAGTYASDAWTFTDVTGNYNNDSGTVSDSISKADAAITVDGYTGVYDGDSHGATGSALGVNSEVLAGLDLGLSFTDVPGGTANWTFTDVTGNYNDASGTAEVVISKADADVTVTPYSVTYDGNSHLATGSATGVNAEDLSAGLDLSLTDHTNAGTYAFDPWTFTGGTNYEDENGTVSDSISKAAATVVVNGYAGVYDAAAHGATGTATGVNSEDLSASLDLGSSFTDVPGGTASWTFTGGTNYNDASGSVNIDISQADADVTVTPYSVTYDGNTHTATGFATGVNAEDLSSGLDLSGTTHTAAGSYPTDAWSFEGGVNYQDENGTVSDSIGKADASITVTGYTGVYDAAAHGATGTATGIGGADLSASLNLVGATFTNVPGGTASWTFVEPSGNYNDASGDVAITINKADADITVTPYSVPFDGNSHTATGSALGVEGETLAGLDLSGTTHTNAGSYPTDAWTFTDITGNYNDDAGTVADAIGKVDADITVTGYTGVYDGAAHGATGSATGVNSEDLSASLSLGSSFTDVPGGTADWTFTGGTNYNDASGSVNIDISKADAVIDVTPYSVSYDGSAHTAVGTATGILAEALSGLDLSGTTHTAAGDYPADAWSFTDVTGNYNNDNGTVHDAIDSAVAEVNLSGLAQTYDATGKSATVDTVPSGLTVDVTYDGSAILPVAAGSYAVEATVNDPNYVGSAAGTLVIAARDIQVTADDQSKEFGSADPGLTYLVTSGSLAGSDSFSGALTRDAGEAVGTYAITQGTLDLGSNYNLSFAPGTLTITDTAAPVIAAHADITAEATSAAGAAVTYTAPDATDAVDGTFAATCAPASGTTFALGTTTVTCNASDTAGNDATPTTFSVTVQDTTSPVITLSGSDPVTVEVGSPYADAGATASDNIDGDISGSIVTVNPVNTAVLGDYVVTYNVSDSHGNAALEVTRDVHVVDSTAPVVNISAPAEGETTGTATDVIFAVNDAAATLSCTLDGLPVSCDTSPVSLTALSEGSHTFAATAEDGSGNIGSASVTWTVDATGPVVEITSGPADGSTITVDNGTFTFATNPVETATFECALDGGSPVDCSSGSFGFTGLSDGPHTFSVQAKDAYGNSGAEVSSSFTIDTVEEAPVITNETTSLPTETSMTITWDTDHPATSRVVYGTASVSDLDAAAAGAPNYGYTDSTTEDSATTTSHSVLVSGLTPGTQYFFRAVSHGSPEAISNELTASTTEVVGPTVGSLQVTKVTVGGDGTFDFSGPADFQIATAGGTGSYTAGELTPGTYSVVETAQSGWTETGNTCQDVVVAAGQTATCTITNAKDSAPPTTGSLTMTKNAENGDGTFQFTGDAGSFQITTHDGNGQHTVNNLTPGTYSVSENASEDWEQTGNTCENVVVVAGQTATCTMTNTKEVEPPATTGSLKVIKIAEGVHHAKFNFTGDAGSFKINTHNGHGSKTIKKLDPGTYSVNETPQDGWTETDNTCQDVEIVAGQVSTCTITNEKTPHDGGDDGDDDPEKGKIVILKTTVDGDDDFTFTPSYGPAFELSNGETRTKQNLDPGTYSVSESLPDGWTQTSATCDDGSEPGAIDLAAGETVTCTFVNTFTPVEPQTGTIVVEKVTDPSGDETNFDFSASYDSDGFVLSDGEGNASDDLNPGTYSVSEAAVSGWDSDGGACLSSNGDSETADNISLQAGETVVCTFTNTSAPEEPQPGVIVVKKVTDPSGDQTSFNFSASYNNDGFALADGGQNTSENLDSGTYSVSESLPDGWTQTSATCDDGSEPGAIDLAAGETVTCTFVNTKQTEGNGGGNGNGNGGNGNGGSGRRIISSGSSGSTPPPGQVLGASTTTATTTLPELPASCTQLLFTYMRWHKQNDASEVKKLQQFLNEQDGAGLPITGYFGPLTDAAVKVFQLKHAGEILKPWGIAEPTGYVFKTTQRWINMVQCSALNLPPVKL